ncbi:ESPR-type extended signal peptide-containing protein [Veillonella agrestimuris]|uniref:ESPR-type extended signal peptide-containing protein n=1 Tax=Veillonella agrestimuris TaxID=2941340 RepID=UPI0020414EC1|nr:ESPR-type extended signal peptide-containing protein [Veillonella agrestimuris]
MNKIFKVIWNRRTQCWVAVPEVTKAQGKTKSSTVMLVAALLTAGTVALGGGQAGAYTAGGGTVGTDSAAIAIGDSASATGVQAVALGHSANASGRMAIATGRDANASKDAGIAIGAMLDSAYVINSGGKG